jgi:hypothetical protein
MGVPFRGGAGNVPLLPSFFWGPSPRGSRPSRDFFGTTFVSGGWPDPTNEALQGWKGPSLERGL